MCGRFSLQTPWSELYKWLDLTRPQVLNPEMPPRYNIAPTQPIMVVQQGQDDAREGVLVRWGFVPAWVEDPKAFTLIINARSETVVEKPSFKMAIRRRRILIPANGFYEWQRYGKARKSQPYYVRPAHGGTIAFGGLMETWMGANGSEIDTACIITTEANTAFAPIHHRLPLVVQPQHFERWLNCRDHGLADVTPLFKPVEDEFFVPVPVSDAVNKVANSGPNIQEPVSVDAVTERGQEDDADNQLDLF